MADLFGPDWSRTAREVAVRMSRGHDEDDRRVQVLWDIRTVKELYGRSSIGSKPLCKRPINLEGSHYGEWTGVDDKTPPYRLKENELAHIPKSFGVKPRVVWPFGTKQKSCRGYAWEWFRPCGADTRQNRQALINKVAEI